ncbi:MAG: ABC transporter ATP-binding protein [Alphaproteobacteria bacterium]|nr:ABC transporter ATP-binding protein [Alphaproteobacteria bacterium]
MADVKIAVDGVSKQYFLYKSPLERLLHVGLGIAPRGIEIFNALSDVSFTVRRGECVGIIGRNGSGKSTLLYIIANTLSPTRGTVRVQGRVAALLELGSGFNPEFNGRENIFFYASMLGLSRAEITARLDDIIEFSGIRDFIDRPLKTYSSGMAMRLAFAVTSCIDPEVLIVDEALSVGDEAFQRKCMMRLTKLKEAGTTILFVSHSARSVTELCDRAIWLDRGDMLMDGPPDEVMVAYQRFSHMDAAKAAEYRALVRDRDPDFLSQGESRKSNKSKLQLSGENQKKAGAAALDSYFDPNLVPESIVIHDSHGALIEAPQIREVDGEGALGRAVNTLVRGRDYAICYTVKFLEDAHQVAFSSNIQTVNGTMLGGGSLLKEGQTIDLVRAGETVAVEHVFSCRLLRESFFVSVGCSGLHHGERLPLHRITDALMFTVLAERGYNGSGIVDFGFRSRFNRLPAPIQDSQK